MLGTAMGHRATITHPGAAWHSRGVKYPVPNTAYSQQRACKLEAMFVIRGLGVFTMKRAGTKEVLLRILPALLLEIRCISAEPSMA